MCVCMCVTGYTYSSSVINLDTFIFHKFIKFSFKAIQGNAITMLIKGYAKMSPFCLFYISSHSALLDASWPSCSERWGTFFSAQFLHVTHDVIDPDHISLGHLFF